jgi:subtilisin family serine protease/photosystem II stability/assembly factor-like uncharacterized protein
MAENRSYLTQLEQRQQALLAPLAKLNAHILYRLQKVYNGIALTIDRSALPELAKLPGVKAIHELTPKALSDTSSADLIGALKLWYSAGVTNTGTGVKIGIIDSGIDYKNADFGGNASTTITTSPKVLGGKDFVGDNYDLTGIPAPDNDPIDCSTNGHGTHVAGIAAGYGVNADGTPYTGSYDPAVVPSNTMKIGPGIAPGASLYALRVFGCREVGSSSLVVDQAIEWAVDPNGDGDYSDHLDIINMSLSGDFGSPYDSTSVASNNAALLGIIVVAAAGNAGDTYYAGGTPANADRVISVGSSVDSLSILNAFKVNSPASIAITYPATYALFPPSLITNPVTGTLALPANIKGCTPFDNADAAVLNGKIALLERGPSNCPFKLKVYNAQQAGAVGVLIYNDVSGAPVPMPDSSTVTTTTTIPVMMTDLATGNLLKTNLQSGPVNVTLSDQYRNAYRLDNPQQVDTLSSFSSRGPRLRDSALKPDLVAPGETVFSAKAGTASDGFSDSGTSMAAPQVAGAAALLRQLKPKWSVEELKALLMNTASSAVRTSIPLNSQLYGPGRIGSGRVDVFQASRSNVIAYNADNSGLVSLSFGTPEVVVPLSKVLTRTLKIANKGATPATYQVGYNEVVAMPGAKYTLSTNNVTVPANSSLDLIVTLNLDPAQLKHSRDNSVSATQAGSSRNWLSEAGGYVVLTPTVAVSPTLQVPVYAAPRLAASMSSPSGPFNFGASASANTSIALSGQGINTGPNYPTDLQSLVTPLELQYTNPNPGPSYADLKQVGVSANYAAAGNNLANTTLYFGLVTQGAWTTPNKAEIRFDIYIDVNGDGLDDYLLTNSPDRTFGSIDYSDGFRAYICSLLGNNCTPAEYLNVLDPASRDTALFNSSAVILAVKASQLGLYSGSSRIRYRVQTSQREQIGPVSTTPPLIFDPARPGLNMNTADPANPTFPDSNGQSIPVSYNLANFAASSSKGVLLLHHHNPVAFQSQVIPVSYTAPRYSSSPAPGSLLNVGIGQLDVPLTTTLLISQTGNLNLSVNNPQINGPNSSEFAVISTTFPIQVAAGSNQLQQIVVQCIPGDLGVRNATLTLTTNDPGYPTVSYNLACTGRPPAYISTTDGTWVWQNPLPQGGKVSGVYCVSDTTCYTTNTNTGIVVATADSGQTWFSQPTGMGGITDIKCPTSDDCYVAGYLDGPNLTAFVGVAFTKDGGSSWITKTLGGLTLAVPHLSCPNSNTCFVTGKEALYATTDGGTTWNPLAYSLTDYTFPDVSCPGLNTCYLSANYYSATPENGGRNYLLRMNLAGNTPGWTTLVTSTAIYYQRVECPALSVCFSTGVSLTGTGANTTAVGTILGTTNGTDWAVQKTSGAIPWQGLDYVPYVKISCTSPTNCRVNDNENHGFLRTSDGVNWVSDSTPNFPAYYLMGLHCPSSGTCYAVGLHGVAYRLSGANPWLLLNPGYYNTYTGINCPTTAICYGVSDAGDVRITDNGGNSWQEYSYPSLPGTISFSGVSCGDRLNCYAIGNYTDAGGNPATAVITTGNGFQYITVTTISVAIAGFQAPQLQAITCPSVTTCFAVGSINYLGTDYGLIIFNTKSGDVNSWQLALVTDKLTGISCPTTSVCYATGGASIWYTVNGGFNWSQQTPQASFRLDNISCPTVFTCYAVGISDTTVPTQTKDRIVVLTSTTATTPGSWNISRPGLPTKTDLATIACPDSTSCYVGQYGWLLTTRNGGGGNWEHIFIAENLKSLNCPGPNECLGSGTGGMIVSNVTTWRSRPDPSKTNKNLTRLTCPTATDCIALGEQGTILVSPDSGQNWGSGIVPPVANNRTLHDLNCVGRNCITVGDGGLILSSNNLGLNWTAQTSPTASNLYGVSCVVNCAIVGAGGVILKSTDWTLGSSDWTLGSSQVTTHTLYGVSCVVSCVAVGEAGVILLSSDWTLGSSDWTLGSSQVTTRTLYGVNCAASCVAVGEAGTILVNSDWTLGSSDWTLGSSRTVNNLFTVSCDQVGNCLTAGANGTILGGSNRKSSWSAQESSTLKELQGIACAQSCLSIGEDGTLVAQLFNGFFSIPAPGGIITVGNTTVGNPITTTFTVGATGNVDVTLNAPVISNTTVFSISGATFPLVLKAGVTTTLTIGCNSSTAGTISTTLTFSTNDLAHPTATYTLVCNVFNNATPGFNSNPPPGTAINFGSSPVAVPVTTSLILLKAGQAPLVVTNTAITGPQAGEFAVLTGGFPLTLDQAIPTRTLQLQCTPAIAGSRVATLTLTTNDPTQPSVSYALSCNGYRSNYSSIPSPGSQLNFGKVLLGQVATSTIKVKTGSSTTLVLTDTLLLGLNPNDFQVISPTFPLTVVGEQEIVVRCNPTQVGPRSATLQVINNDPTFQVNSQLPPFASYSLSCTGIENLVVDHPGDDGLRTTVGTLSYALQRAGQYSTITFVPSTGLTVTVSKPLPPLRPGATIQGICDPAKGPLVVIDAGAANPALAGLILEGDNSVSGLWLKGFKGGALLKTLPQVNNNHLKCVKVQR